MTGLTRVVLLIAGALLAAGLIVGFALPVKSAGYSCGSAFHESSDLQVDRLSDTLIYGSAEVDDCDGARSSARVLPVVLLVLGGVALLGAPFIERSQAGNDVGESVPTDEA